METEYIFISPHLDDAVLSCGELIYKLVNNKEEISEYINNNYKEQEHKKSLWKDVYRYEEW